MTAMTVNMGETFGPVQKVAGLTDELLCLLDDWATASWKVSWVTALTKLVKDDKHHWVIAVVDSVAERRWVLAILPCQRQDQHEHDR